MLYLAKMAKRALFISLAILGLGSLAVAQTTGVGTWPTQKPIRLIAVFPPGGSVDQVARVFAPALQSELKQNVIVENIGGASGVIGTSAMTRADAEATPLRLYLIPMALTQVSKTNFPTTRLKILRQSFWWVLHPWF